MSVSLWELNLHPLRISRALAHCSSEVVEVVLHILVSKYVPNKFSFVLEHDLVLRLTMRAAFFRAIFHFGRVINFCYCFIIKPNGN